MMPKRASISYEGPFSNEKDANDILRSYLKHGICCWIINTMDEKENFG